MSIKACERESKYKQNKSELFQDHDKQKLAYNGVQNLNKIY